MIFKITHINGVILKQVQDDVPNLSCTYQKGLFYVDLTLCK